VAQGGIAPLGDTFPRIVATIAHDRSRFESEVNGFARVNTRKALDNSLREADRRDCCAGAPYH